MTFHELCRIEEKIKWYNSLIEKYFNEKSLEERTKINDIKIEDICQGKELIELCGTHYCFSISEKNDCKHQCQKNSSNIHPCSKFYANGLSHFDIIMIKADTKQATKSRIYIQ